MRCSQQRGLDHAAWAVLIHLFPDADVPVLELSLDTSRPESDHLLLGRALGPLRAEGILIICSGDIVHNLGAMAGNRGASFDWAVLFDEAVKRALMSGDHDQLAAYRRTLPHASLAVPTNDHYLPLLYAVALQRSGERVIFTHESIQHGSISMRCFRID